MSERPSYEFTFALSGADADSLQGCISVIENESSHFKLTVAPAVGGVIYSFSPEDVFSVQLNLSGIYFEKSGVYPLTLINEVIKKSAVSYGTNTDRFQEDGVDSLSWKPKSTLWISEQQPLIFEIFLAQATAHNKIHAGPIEVRLMKAADLLADVSYRFGNKHTLSGENIHVQASPFGPVERPKNLHTEMKWPFKIQANLPRDGYIEIPPHGDFLELHFGGLLNREDIKALEKTSLSGFHVLPTNDDSGLRIASNRAQTTYLYARTPFACYLEAVQLSGQGTHRSGQITLSSLLDSEKKILWRSDAAFLELGFTVQGHSINSANQIRLEENAKNEFTLTLSALRGFGTVNGIIELDFHGMLSQAELTEILGNLPAVDSQSSGCYQVVEGKLRISNSFILDAPYALPISLTKKGPIPQWSSSLTVRFLYHAPQTALDVILKESNIDILGHYKSLKACSAEVVSDLSDLPLCFLPQTPVQLSAKITLEEEGRLLILPEEPLLEIDFKELLPVNILSAWVSHAPPGFRFEQTNSTTLKVYPINEIQLLREPTSQDKSSLTLSLGTMVLNDYRQKRDGSFHLSLLDKNGHTARSESKSYRIRDLAITVTGPEKSVRNDRLYLKSRHQNEFGLIIRPLKSTPDVPMNLTLHRAHFKIDFGRILTDKELDQLVQHPFPGYRASRINEAPVLRLDSEKALVISSENPLKIPFDLLPFEGPDSKPYGTFLVSLDVSDTVIATEEIDVSIHREDLKTGATPPVFVSWNNGKVPKLPAGQSSDYSFVLINNRKDDLGDARNLITNPWITDSGVKLNPCVRLFIPPALVSDEMVAFNPSSIFTEIEIHSTSGKDGSWTTKKVGLYQELHPRESCFHVLEKADFLKVTLKNIRPAKAGQWSLSVTLVDFPGYASTTFMLPIEVVAG